MRSSQSPSSSSPTSERTTPDETKPFSTKRLSSTTESMLSALVIQNDLLEPLKNEKHLTQP